MKRRRACEGVRAAECGVNGRAWRIRWKHRLEDVADEMLAIKDLRDRLVDKHISEHANQSINELYRNINED